MMYLASQYRLIFFTLIALGAVFNCSKVLAEASSPAFWKIQNIPTNKAPPRTLYLLGSMHFGHEKFYPLPSTIDKAFNESDTLVVEVDLNKVDPNDVSKHLSAMGALGGGNDMEKSKLEQALSPSSIAKISELSPLIGADEKVLLQFKPWFLALQVAGLQLNKSKFRQELGIDRYFLNKAGIKKVEQLETFEEQLNIFDRLSYSDQVVFLEQALDSYDEGLGYLNSMGQAWFNGDIKKLEELVVQPFKVDSSSQRLYEAVFIQRNKLMTDSAYAFLSAKSSNKTPKTKFMIVGAGHLISEDGVVERLKALGMKVKRL